MYYGDQGDQPDWELHPDTDELLMVLEAASPWRSSPPPTDIACR
jgi:hypothetical protein